MVCTRPLVAWEGPGGAPAFRPEDGFRDRPLSLPCSKCPGCRQRRVQMWATRCLHELAIQPRSSFVTLTYSPQQLPDPPSVSKAAWQLFAKRLRERLGPFRFFMCGEYGGLTYRPHYHALIFGHDFAADREEVNNNKSEYRLYRSSTLDSVWQHGSCTIGDVGFESAAYVAGYILKGGPELVVAETGEVLERPFQLMSRRPGLGAGWFERFHTDVYPSDEVISSTGKPMGVPRYYDKLLEKESPEVLATIKARRKRRAREAKPRDLHARELIDNAKAHVRGL